MKFAVMDQVYITNDTLNFDLPIGELAFVIAIDRKIDQAQKYCVRIPSNKKTVWVPECDLCPSEEYLSEQVDEVIRTSLVNYALDTKNRELFERQVKR